MNKPKFAKFVEQAGKTTDCADEGINSSIKSQEMQVNCSSARIGQFSSLLPVLFGYNYKINTLTTITGSESIAVASGNGDKNEEIKELWSAEELTVNLVNKTAMRIANLKHKLDEQLKTIKILQGNNEKYRECSQLIHEEKNVDNSQLFQNSSLSSKGGKIETIKELKKRKSPNKHAAKMKTSTSTKIGIQRPIASQIKRKRLRRGVSIKEFFYHPLVVDCSASMPEELTKEEFLRQLRLIPTTYLMSHDPK